MLQIDEDAVLLQAQLIDNSIRGSMTISEFYRDAHPLTSALVVHIVLMITTFIAGTAQNEHSHIDRLWSLLPCVTVCHYFIHTYFYGTINPRLLMYTVVVLIWSVRLTFNFARKGGYSGTEDYRWKILRSKIPSALFLIFSLVFISITQLLLLLAITTPALVLLDSTDVEWTAKDLIVLVLLLCCILIEITSDNEMWRYQNAKAQYKITGTISKDYTQAELERGFCTRGTFAYSRHANFFAEQTFWTLPYLWSINLTGDWISWPMIGPCGYILLFQASTTLTEAISKSRYPAYAEYQRVVGRFLPSLRVSRWTEN
ncbi:uncharacterized protein V1518DRAFT_411922 [Limtongia smithiae]|uniref:uncharacterized protein n=1 Tax=Limtongia smithiae TaxID=1125753 RepID=UPI0034CD85FA